MLDCVSELETGESVVAEEAEHSWRSRSGRLRVADWMNGDVERGTAGDKPPRVRAPQLQVGFPESNGDAIPLRKPHFQTTRRQLGVGVAATLLIGLVSARFWDAGYFADLISRADLMRSGPLGEEAVGEEHASHTLIEYTSLTCPHCAGFFNETFPALKASYIDTGKVRFILREFPLDGLARAVAVLARHAEPERYFAFVQALFRRQQLWVVNNPIEPLFAIAAEFGFTRDRFMTAFSDQRVIAGVDWVSLRAARTFKVDSTPTSFIDGKMYKGRMSLEQLAQVLKL